MDIMLEEDWGVSGSYDPPVPKPELPLTDEVPTESLWDKIKNLLGL